MHNFKQFLVVYSYDYLKLVNLDLLSRQVNDTNIEMSFAADEETQLVLDSICEKSLPVIRMGKQFFQQQVKLDMLEAYRWLILMYWIPGF